MMRIFEEIPGKPGFGSIVIYESERLAMPQWPRSAAREYLRRTAQLAGLVGDISGYSIGNNDLMLVGEIGAQFSVED